MHLQIEYTAYSGMYSKSLDGMPLILSLLESELSLQVLCKNLAHTSRSPLPPFNGFQIVNESIRVSLKNVSGESRWLPHEYSLCTREVMQMAESQLCALLMLYVFYSAKAVFKFQSYTGHKNC